MSDAKADTNVTMCSILSLATLACTVVKLRQDVTDKEENECHTDRDGGTLCDFDVTSDEEGFLLFPPLEEQLSVEYEKNRGGKTESCRHASKSCANNSVEK